MNKPLRINCDKYSAARKTAPSLGGEKPQMRRRG